MARLWYKELWTRLERASAFDRALFARAQLGQRALQPFASALHAARAAAATRDQAERDGIVAAFAHEYRERPNPLWSAAAVVAMAPALGSLVRTIRKHEERNDARSLVVLAFLECVNRITTEHRFAFRLYSETRRCVLLRTQRTQRDETVSARPTAVDRDPPDGDLESALDRARLARRARALLPLPGEVPADYLERVTPSRTRRERLERRRFLRTCRAATLVDVHEQLRALPLTPAEETK